MLSYYYSHSVILIVNVINLRNYNFQRGGKNNFPAMADEFDIDDLLEAPYQKVKNEETEVNINKVLFLVSFLIQIKTLLYLQCCIRRCKSDPIIYPALFL